MEETQRDAKIDRAKAKKRREARLLLTAAAGLALLAAAVYGLRSMGRFWPQQPAALIQNLQPGQQIPVLHLV